MQITKRLILTLGITLCCLASFADNIPALQKKLKNIRSVEERIDSAWAYCNEYADEPEEWFLLGQIEKFAQQLNDKECLCKVYRNMARYIFNYREDFKDIPLYADKIKALGTDSELADKCLTDIRCFNCYAYIEQKDYGRAIDVANRFWNEAEESESLYARASANEILGIINQSLAQYDVANDYFVKAYNFCKLLPDQKQYCIQLLFEVCECSMLTKKLSDKGWCINDLHTLIAADKKARYYERNLRVTETFAALMELEENRPDKALRSIEKAKTYNAQEDHFANMLLLVAESKYHWTCGNMQKAYERVSTTMYEGGYRLYIIYKIDLLKAMGRWQEVAAYQQRINDRMKKEYCDAINSQVNEMSIETKIHEQKLGIAQAQLQASQWQNRFYIFCSILLLLLIILFAYMFYSTRKGKKEVEQANQTQKNFLQNMSHEIRTPLNAICGFSQILTTPGLREMVTEEEMAEYADIIQTNTELLGTLVNDILDVSDLDSGKYRMNMGDCPVNTVCRKAINTVRYRCPDHIKLYFTTEVDDDFTIHSDPQRAQQIIMNYLTNAIKHTEQGEIHVHCSLSEHPGKVTFSVTDTGEGVPADKADIIFGRFEKLDTFKQGTGLGLNICLRIAKLMNAEVKLDTSYTGGARFVFIHPLPS